MTDIRTSPDKRGAWFSQQFETLADSVETVIKGKRDIIGLALISLLAEGHLLIEDAPGMGKTSLAKALAASIDARWRRIQFTPDLLPSDITGVSALNPATRTWEFHPGPVFANVVLADEINRASPKTQSALLEVMEEQHVTIDARPHAVPRPFIVIATQNPIDLEGTYRLPEAQLDRFLIRTGIGYPGPEEEAQILAGQTRRLLPEQLTPVMTGDEVRAMIAIANEVHAAPSLCQYIVQVGAATRAMGALRLGVSTRGNLALLRAARAHAAATGRMYVTPEDVKALAVPVLAHRLILDADADLRRTDPKGLVAEALAAVPVPRTAQA